MRYFGGKSRIAKYISEYINNLAERMSICNILEANKESQNTSQNILIPHTHTYNTYIEPFCGACNVASKIHIKNKILNDKHPYLIAMFKALQKGWIPPTEVSEKEYQYIKQNQDEDKALAGFVGFACSFAGKYWGGYARDSKGGGTGNYALRGHNSILKKMENLQNAKFTNKDFRELNFKNSLIYCDPPYKNTTPYYKKLLGEFPYNEFLDWVYSQSKNNIVLVSEYKHNTPKNANIVLEIPSKTSIRNKNDKVIETVEVLYTYNSIK